MKKQLSFLLSVVVALLLVVSGVYAQNAKLTKSVIGGGGMVGLENSNGIKLSGVTGQFAIGTLTNSNPGANSYNLNQGFWVPEPQNMTDIEDEPVTSNKDFFNYPNPVTNSTTFEFNLPAAAYITLKVYDMVGNEVKTIYDGFEYAGVHRLSWDTKGDNGLALPAGSFMYELQVRSADMAGAGSFNNYVMRSILVIVR